MRLIVELGKLLKKCNWTSIMILKYSVFRTSSRNCGRIWTPRTLSCVFIRLPISRMTRVSPRKPKRSGTWRALKWRTNNSKRETSMSIFWVRIRVSIRCRRRMLSLCTSTRRTKIWYTASKNYKKIQRTFCSKICKSITGTSKKRKSLTRKSRHWRSNFWRRKRKIRNWETN